MTAPQLPLDGMADVIGEGLAELLNRARKPDREDSTPAPGPGPNRSDPDQSASARAPFGVRPEEIEQTASAWRRESKVVAELKLDALSAVSGAMSDVTTALHSASTSAVPTIASISARLATLADSLMTFNAMAIDRDDRAAASLRSVPTR
ncbi:Uncharacterised protein [Mycobacteroides abscessus subsp. abscessus]|nr:Uncharacterised protein [Mycobacteroides abscessus subsp. abscessus]